MKTKTKLLAFGIFLAARAWLLPTLLAQSTYEPYTFTTLAGNADHGSDNGPGSAARFNRPSGVAVDSTGNFYVADSNNSTIRKVTPAGEVTTLAGLAGSFGSADGRGSATRFAHNACFGSGPTGVAVDGEGNVYVADSANYTIRKVTPTGVVTTLAGPFFVPRGLAVDSAGTVYVADSSNSTIRKVTSAEVVTTLAGLTDGVGSADGSGSAARFAVPSGVSVDSAGNVYVADRGNSTIRKGYPEHVPLVIVAFGPGFGFTGGQFGFILTGPAGRLVVVEASADLVSWLPLWTNTFAGALNFSDPQSGVYSNRFYRARLP